jgi:hypothetical protein
MKIAFTGTHGTGKTTSVFELARVLKIEHPDKHVNVLVDVAGRSPYKKNKDATLENQLWVFGSQMINEMTMLNMPNCDILVGDRSIMDSIGYTICSGQKELGEKQFNYCLDYLNTYDKIIFKQIATNDFLFQNNIRDHLDLEYRQFVENTLMNLYKRAINEHNCKFTFEVI